MNTALALRYAKWGPPEEVLRLETVPLPAIGPDQALVKMLAAPIHPSDIGMIGGRYGRLNRLPATGGREGLGEVLAVGKAVTNVCVGERVLLKEAPGTWQTAFVMSTQRLQRVPATLPFTTAAMSSINPPTAWLLLHDTGVPLQPGDWVLQNAANSAVGLCVIGLARKLGLRTFNVVRRAELVAPLKSMGADVVVTEQEDYMTQAKALLKGAPVRLALNSVGGRSAINQIQILAQGGTQVTFGAMDFERVRFPTRFLIFNDIRLTGFWLERWQQDHPQTEIQKLFESVFAALQEGTFAMPVEKTYPLKDYQEALAHHAQPRLGKVLFVGDTPS